VSEIWQYAVKSMVGQTIDSAKLDGLGIVGDRRWAIRDLERGGIRGGKKIGGLMAFSARFTGHGEEALITLPDGTQVTTSDADVDDRISAVLGRPVRLDALRPASDVDHFRRGEPDSDDLIAEIRAIMGREDDEPLPDFSIFPPEIMEYESPLGAYYDAFALMIMSTSSLRSLAAALPDSVIDVRRFRPSFVIDTGDAPGHPELSWPQGQRVSVGAAVIEIVAPCPRCVMPTLRIDDSLTADRSILRYIVRDLDQNLGTYANVVTPGPIRVGDAVTLL
jgi:uncharacterized protein